MRDEYTQRPQACASFAFFVDHNLCVEVHTGYSET
jgi:hypothetical protein